MKVDMKRASFVTHVLLRSNAGTRRRLPHGRRKHARRGYARVSMRVTRLRSQNVFIPKMRCIQQAIGVAHASWWLASALRRTQHVDVHLYFLWHSARGIATAACVLRDLSCRRETATRRLHCVDDTRGASPRARESDSAPGTGSVQHSLDSAIRRRPSRVAGPHRVRQYSVGPDHAD
jgi:hypothetical protein